MSTTFDVALALDLDGATLLCRDERFDAIVVDEHWDDANAVDFLMKMVREQPGAARILLMGDKDRFVTLQARSFAAIDHFLLREDAHTYLVSAIRDGICRRNIE